MFAFVIVAFVILLALTAFVPKVQTGMQWLYKKAGLVLNLLAIGIVYTVIELVLLVGLIIAGVIYCAGRLLVAAGSWVLTKLDNIDRATSAKSKHQVDKAFNRFG